jgi:lipopolysaccharide/colanic/teichoic acid biosynthesis glycosyltransferase
MKVAQANAEPVARAGRRRATDGRTSLVHGLRGRTPLIDRIEFDNDCIGHRSLSLDPKIVLLTIPALLRRS